MDFVDTADLKLSACDFEKDAKRNGFFLDRAEMACGVPNIFNGTAQKE